MSVATKVRRFLGLDARRNGSGWAALRKRLIGGDGVRSHPYEAAESNRLNKKHWEYVTGADADSVIFAALEVVRNRARHEIRNNGYAEGMVETYAADCVGPQGPTLQVEFGADQWNADVELGWAEWCEQCDLGRRMHLADKLRLAVRQFFEAGEALEQKVTAPVQTPVKLRLLSIEPDRLSSPLGVDSGAVRGGVEVDADGAPVAYYIMKDHPGSLVYTAGLGDYIRVPAASIYHLYKTNRPGQHRGMPWLAPTLDVFGHLRDLTHNTLLAAELAAALAVLLHTDHPESPFDDCDGVYDIVDLEPGTMSMIPRGWNATQIKPEQPPAQFPDFKRELLKEVGRAVGMPYLVIGADAAGHNYSSARLDTLTYWDHIEMTQAGLARHFCTPLLREWVKEAALSGQIARAPGKWRATWTWPQRKHVDQLKEEEAAILRLASGRSTWLRECKALGADWQEVFNQLAKEMEVAKEKGLALDFGALTLAASSIIGKAKTAEAEDKE
jgi:lambda family phage portal protein